MFAPLGKIQSRLKRKRLDGLLVTQPQNRRYLSGYSATDLSISETSGVLLIPAQKRPLLFTDSRYQLQAEREAAGFEVTLYQSGLLKAIAKSLPALRIKKLGFESDYLLHATYKALTELTQKFDIQLVPLSNFIEKLRARKSVDEINALQKSVRLNEEVFQKVYTTLQPGQTEKQVAAAIEATMREMGAEGPSFEIIVASGPNGALPHAVPTDRPLRAGEPIVIDMGLKLDGYCSDMTRTVVLGKIDDHTRTIFRIVRQAQLASLRAIRPGIKAQQADRAARQLIAKHGYGKNFGHSLGHGVGLAVHEAPSLSRHNRKKIYPGMVVTVEPGIYLPGWGGVRLENMVAVDESGYTLLNSDTTFLDL